MDTEMFTTGGVREPDLATEDKFDQAQTAF
jgi:hypothetical protein